MDKIMTLLNLYKTSRANKPVKTRKKKLKNFVN